MQSGALKVETGRVTVSATTRFESEVRREIGASLRLVFDRTADRREIAGLGPLPHRQGLARAEPHDLGVSVEPDGEGSMARQPLARSFAR